MGHAVHIDCIFCFSAWSYSSGCMHGLNLLADVENVKQFLQKQKHLKSFGLTLSDMLGLFPSCKEV